MSSEKLNQSINKRKFLRLSAGAAISTFKNSLKPQDHNPNPPDAGNDGSVLDIENVPHNDLLNYLLHESVTMIPEYQAPHWSELVPQEHKERFAQYENEFPQIIKRIRENKGEIEQIREGSSLLDLRLLEIYFPIYRFAHDTFNIPWHLLWITHDAESNMSTNDNMFNNGSMFGAMQRNTSVYWRIPENAINGYEFLAIFPTKHPSDWQEIMFAANKLNNDAIGANKPNDRMWAIADALHAYCRSDIAKSRFKDFELTTEVFN